MLDNDNKYMIYTFVLNYLLFMNGIITLYKYQPTILLYLVRATRDLGYSAWQYFGKNLNFNKIFWQHALFTN